MEKKEIIQEMSNILKPRGFVRKGDSFVRIQGDGVLQTIVLYREHTNAWIYIEGGVFTIDEPKMFDYFGEFDVAQLTIFRMKHFEGYCPEIGLGAETLPQVKDYDSWEELSVSRQLEILQNACISVLDTIKTQEDLYRFRVWMDKKAYGEIREKCYYYLYLFLRARRYQKAVACCDERIADAELAFQVNCKIWKPEEIVRERKRYDEKEKEFYHIKELIEGERYDEIENLLDANRRYNFNVYLSAMGKSVAPQMEQLGIEVDWAEIKERNRKEKEAAELEGALMAYLNCPCRYFPPVGRDSSIRKAYREAVSRGQETGTTPVLIIADDRLWISLLMNSDRESAEQTGYIFEPGKVEAYRRELCALKLDGKETARLLVERRKEQLSEDSLDWEKDVLGKITGGKGSKSLESFRNFSTWQTYPLILTEIPVKNPWEVFAWVPFGGWDECPEPKEMMAVAKHWYEQYGVVPAVIGPDTLEFTVSQPVKRGMAMELAQEQFGFCMEVVEETVGELAGSLAKSTVWGFWWD